MAAFTSSAVVGRVKRSLQQQGFTLPDEQREMIFPHGVTVRIAQNDAAPPAPAKKPKQVGADSGVEADTASTAAEGNLAPERRVIEEQAAASRPLATGDNLLDEKRGA